MLRSKFAFVVLVGCSHMRQIDACAVTACSSDVERMSQSWTSDAITGHAVLAARDFRMLSLSKPLRYDVLHPQTVVFYGEVIDDRPHGM